MAANFSYDVFVSHNSKDKPAVRRLAKRLKLSGLRVWLDDWCIRSGDIISLKVDEGLEQSRVLLLCISPNALGSGWVALERSTAIHRDPTNEGRRFVPLLLADCDLPDTLRRYKYVDFRHEADDAFAEVLTACLPDTVRTPWPAAEKQDGSTLAERVREKRASRTKQPTATPKAVGRKKIKPLTVLEQKIRGKDSIQAIAISPDGKWAASGLSNGGIKIWDLESGDCQASFKGHSALVRSVAFVNSGKYLLSGGQDEFIRLWDLNTAKQVKKIRLKSSATSVCPFPDEELVLIGLTLPGVVVELRSFRSGDHIWRRQDVGYATSVAMHLGTQRALSAHGGSNVSHLQLWHLKTGDHLLTLQGHSNNVNSVQITRDGRFAVSGSLDATVKVWDLDAGTCVGTLEGHQGPVSSIAISPDRTLIASVGSADKTIRLWDWKSGGCIQVIQIEDSPHCTAFSPDGTGLVVGGKGIIYLYRLTGLWSAPSAEVSRRYVNAKVVLLGEGTVGKTSLAHRLIEDKYVVRDRTHGMNV